jgi:hypothetical protein
MRERWSLIADRCSLSAGCPNHEQPLTDNGQRPTDNDQRPTNNEQRTTPDGWEGAWL